MNEAGGEGKEKDSHESFLDTWIAQCLGAAAIFRVSGHLDHIVGILQRNVPQTFSWRSVRTDDRISQSMTTAP